MIDSQGSYKYIGLHSGWNKRKSGLGGERITYLKINFVRGLNASRAGLNSKISTHVIDSPSLPRDTRVKVTLVARPLLTSVTQKLCRCEHGVYASRTCVHSRTLLRIEIVCCFS
jgi:hypothetical protein